MDGTNPIDHQNFHFGLFCLHNHHSITYKLLQNSPFYLEHPLSSLVLPETTTVSPSFGSHNSRKPKYAVFPVMPHAPSRRDLLIDPMLGEGMTPPKSPGKIPAILSGLTMPLSTQPPPMTIVEPERVSNYLLNQTGFDLKYVKPCLDLLQL